MTKTLVFKALGQWLYFAFWIFVVWLVWTFVQAVKSIAASLQDIARSLQNRLDPETKI